jgi:hypothetical protein
VVLGDLGNSQQRIYLSVVLGDLGNSQQRICL